MFPDGLLTVITPSATVHCAGDLSLVDTHSVRLLPSNSTIASAGGGAVVLGPGATIFGTGSQTSVSWGRGFCVAVDGACWAASGSTSAPSSGSVKRRDDLMRMGADCSKSGVRGPRTASPWTRMSARHFHKCLTA